MKKHAVYTELIANGLFPRNVVRIASRHHERLDGSGYPRGLSASDLTTSDRLVAVADVVSALLQKRSYKSALDKETVIDILSSEADGGKLDREIVDLLISEYDEIIGEVIQKSSGTIKTYEGLHSEYGKYLKEYSAQERDALEEFGLFAKV